MSTLVYRYGLLAPAAEAVRVADQIHAAHLYQNHLVEIERNYRTKRDAVINVVEPLVAVAKQMAVVQDQVDLAYDELRARCEEVDDEDNDEVCERIKANILRLKAKKDKFWKPYNAAAKVVKAIPEIAVQLDAFNQQRKAAIRDARAACGVYWGTYLQIEAAMEQARSSMTPPHFQRWDGEGAVAVQLMKGLGLADAFSGHDTRFRLGQVPLPVPGRGGAPLPRVQLRVGSAEDRSPIFAEWPLVYHRPLPQGCTIKWAKVVRRRCGCDMSWSLHITLDIATPVATPVAPTGEGGGERALAVNLRWARDGDSTAELIVADWADDARGGVLHMEQAVESMLSKSASLKSIRDKNFNSQKKLLKFQLGKVTVPDELKERLQFLHAWKAQPKLASVALWWREHRFAGDDEAYQTTEAWRKQDRHLLAWQSNAMRKGLARRRDAYRVFASKAARDYDVLVIEKLNIAKLAKKPDPEEERKQNDIANSQRHNVAPSELRRSLMSAFKRQGKVITEVPAGHPAEEMLAVYHKTGGIKLAAPAARSERFNRFHKAKAAAKPRLEAATV